MDVQQLFEVEDLKGEDGIRAMDRALVVVVMYPWR